MTTSGTTKVALYFVEGEDDETAVVKWCRLDSVNYPSYIGQTVKKFKRILGEFVVIIKDVQKPAYTSYLLPNGDVAIVVKYAKVASLKKVLEVVRDKLCAAESSGLAMFLRKATVMFDCDAEWKRCRKVASARKLYRCGDFRVCYQRNARGEGRHALCSADCRGSGGVGVEVLALVKRVEDLCGERPGGCGVSCSCIC